jgi:hypothetical protein
MSNPTPGAPVPPDDAPVREFRALTDWSNPPSGYCKVFKNRWWIVDQGGNPIVYGKHSAPQCNPSRRIVERLAGLPMYQGFGFSVKQLAAVFLSFNPNDH